METALNRGLMFFVYIIILPAALVVGVACVVIGLWKALIYRGELNGDFLGKLVGSKSGGS